MGKNSIKTIAKLLPCGLALLFAACDGSLVRQQIATEQPGTEKTEKEQIVIDEPITENQSDNIQLVKDYVFPEYPTVKVGRMLEGYQYFSSPKWDEYTTSQGERIVRFTADYKASKEVWEGDVVYVKGPIEIYFAIAELYGNEYVELQKMAPYFYEKRTCGKPGEHNHIEGVLDWQKNSYYGKSRSFMYRDIKDNKPISVGLIWD